MDIQVGIAICIYVLKGRKAGQQEARKFSCSVIGHFGKSRTESRDSHASAILRLPISLAESPFPIEQSEGLEPPQPISNLPSVNCILQLNPYLLLNTQTAATMFRNALRQSTRTVGAISASGRVAAVRTQQPLRRPQSMSNQSQSINTSSASSIESLERWKSMVESCLGSFNSFEFLFFGLRLTDIFSAGTNCHTSSFQRSIKTGPKLRS